jgi:Flp pilus assembly protein CpaB
LKRANRLMLTVGVALAAVSFIAVLAFGGFGTQNGTAKDPDVPVAVTTADLALGSQVAAEQVTASSVGVPDLVSQQAEVVRFAQLDGNISLVSRAPADAQAPTVDTTGVTLRELVDGYGVLPPAPVSPANP